MDPKDLLARVVKESVGRDLSEKDIYDYATFLSGKVDAFDESTRERIRSELAAVVMKNPELAEKISKEYGIHFSERKTPKFADMPRFKIQKGQRRGILFRCNKVVAQKDFIDLLNKKNKKMANAAEVYNYFCSLLYWSEQENYQQTIMAYEEIKNIRSLNKKWTGIHTSTRLFYDIKSDIVKIVHNYNVRNKKQIVADVKLPEVWCNLIDVPEKYKDSSEDILKFLQVLLDTEDKFQDIAKVLGVMFEIKPKDLKLIVPYAHTKQERLDNCVFFMTDAQDAGILAFDLRSDGYAFYSKD